ncbi:AraC family transcriptional regulator [Antrihabitans stalactiti]|uniref:AraC family transcriptional regulator n=1 Tax=Antrihabitans stalactiti TaxID=2584121 RepID=A0A848KPT7_9NOCA|nr:AraC family transcriptional regulator [Antrihabitans stalactiti]NMN98300.1 AraC family transcriptional regulator [Antrihabitans stalactiti]
MSVGTRITGTQNWEAAHRAVEDVYFPHELVALDSPDQVDLTLRTVELGPVTIGRLNWGTDVSIACEYPGAYEVNIPLTGRLHADVGGHEVVSLPGQATVFHTGRPSVITRWTADCHVIGVKFDAEHLEREADRVHSTIVRSRLRLPDQVDITNSAESSWFTLVRALSAQLREPSNLLANPLVGPQLASAVTTAFILAVTPEDANAQALRPRLVKRVLDALHDDPARAWTLADMACIAGTSVRRLQEGFAQYMEVSPTAALLDIRLNRAHDDLARGAGSVADISARWGFSSSSRFAAAYKRRYGTSPSEVRRGLVS